MITQVLRLATGASMADDVAKLEKTDTGKFALGLAKGTIIVTLAVMGIVTFLVIRSVNKTFGKQKNEIASIKNQLFGMQRKNEEDGGTV